VLKEERVRYLRLGEESYQLYPNIRYDYRELAKSGYPDIVQQVTAPNVSLPIMYITPAEQNQGIIGLDIRTDPKRYDSYRRAVTTKSTILSPRVSSDMGGVATFHLYSPLFKNANKKGMATGAIFISIEIQKMFSSALQSFTGRGGDQVMICDVTHMPPVFLYSSINIDGEQRLNGTDSDMFKNQNGIPSTVGRNCDSNFDEMYPSCSSTNLTTMGRVWKITLFRLMSPNYTPSLLILTLICSITIALLILVRTTGKHLARTEEVCRAEKQATELALKGRLLAEEANETRVELLSSISHKLKTPMVNVTPFQIGL
jgi:hypothetical protein